MAISQNTTPKIFISHSSEDNKFVVKLAKDLRSVIGNEDDVWYDFKLKGGDNWQGRIRQEIKDRYIFIIVLSPDAMKSEWVNHEIDMAIRQKHSKDSTGKIIIPIHYRQCEVREDLKTFHIISFLERENYDAAFKELLTALRLQPTNYTCKHSSPIYAVAWSPDGRYIASAGQDRTVHIWNAASGDQLFKYRKHRDWVKSIAWTSDSQRIASAGIDKTVHIWSWDGRSGQQLRVYRGHSDWVNAVAWSPDNERVASASSDKTIHIWKAIDDMQSIPRCCSGHSGGVNAVAWSPDGTRIASGSNDATVKIWDAGTGRSIFTYHGHDQPVRALLWLSHGNSIASASDDSTVQIWNASSGMPNLTYKHNYPVLAIASSLDDSRIVSASFNIVQVWNTETDIPILPYGGHAECVRALACSPDGRHIASASDDKTVQVWSLD